jgi:four helix bundle protein
MGHAVARSAYRVSRFVFGRANPQRNRVDLSGIYREELAAMSGAEELRERVFRFACRTIIFCRKVMPRGPVQRHLAVQLVQAATSIGANLEEATAGQSKADFIAPNVRSLKEARESRYWLRIIQATEPDLKPDLQPLLGESNELVAILTALVRTARSNPNRGGAI